MAMPARITHYYGSVVRFLFLAGALIMLIGLPVMADYLLLPVAVSVVAIIILIAAAGLTNPQLIWTAGVNLLISLTAFVVFQAYAIKAYREYGANDLFFLVTVLLELIFLFALYYSVKTYRGLLLNRQAK